MAFDDYRLPFGTHARRRLRDVPVRYLLWLADPARAVDYNVRHVIVRHLESTRADEVKRVAQVDRGRWRPAPQQF